MTAPPHSVRHCIMLNYNSFMLKACAENFYKKTLFRNFPDMNSCLVLRTTLNEKNAHGGLILPCPLPLDATAHSATVCAGKGEHAGLLLLVYISRVNGTNHRRSVREAQSISDPISARHFVYTLWPRHGYMKFSRAWNIFLL